MARHIIYKCDVCGKAYPERIIQATENDRELIAKIPALEVEVCRNCLIIIKGFVKELKLNKYVRT